MAAALLLLILGAAAIVGCFYLPSAAGIAVAIVGLVLLWCALLAACKRLGWLR